MFRKFIVLLLMAAAASLPAPLAAQTVKIGLINSYTGFVAQAGDEGQRGIDLYIKEHVGRLQRVAGSLPGRPLKLLVHDARGALGNHPTIMIDPLVLQLRLR